MCQYDNQYHNHVINNGVTRNHIHELWYIEQYDASVADGCVAKKNSIKISTGYADIPLDI